MNKPYLVVHASELNAPNISVNARAMKDLCALVNALDRHLSAAGLRADLDCVKVDHRASAYLVPLASRYSKEANLQLIDAEVCIKQVDQLREKLTQLLEVLASPEIVVRDSHLKCVSEEQRKCAQQQLLCAESIASALKNSRDRSCTISLDVDSDASQWKLKPKMPTKYKDARIRLRDIKKSSPQELVKITTLVEGPCSGYIMTDGGQVAYATQREVSRALRTGQAGYYFASTHRHPLPILMLHRPAGPHEIPAQNGELFEAEEG